MQRGLVFLARPDQPALLAAPVGVLGERGEGEEGAGAAGAGQARQPRPALSGVGTALAAAPELPGVVEKLPPGRGALVQSAARQHYSSAPPGWAGCRTC